MAATPNAKLQLVQKMIIMLPSRVTELCSNALKWETHRLTKA